MTEFIVWFLIGLLFSLAFRLVVVFKRTCDDRLFVLQLADIHPLFRKEYLEKYESISFRKHYFYVLRGGTDSLKLYALDT